jgi:hypothetical protein
MIGAGERVLYPTINQEQHFAPEIGKHSLIRKNNFMGCVSP